MIALIPVTRGLGQRARAYAGLHIEYILLGQKDLNLSARVLWKSVLSAWTAGKRSESLFDVDMRTCAHMI